jgi:hypothetical protein
VAVYTLGPRARPWGAGALGAPRARAALLGAAGEGGHAAERGQGTRRVVSRRGQHQCGLAGRAVGRAVAHGDARDGLPAARTTARCACAPRAGLCVETEPALLDADRYLSSPFPIVNTASDPGFRAWSGEGGRCARSS